MWYNIYISLLLSLLPPSCIVVPIRKARNIKVLHKSRCALEEVIHPGVFQIPKLKLFECYYKYAQDQGDVPEIAE